MVAGIQLLGQLSSPIVFLSPPLSFTGNRFRCLLHSCQNDGCTVCVHLYALYWCIFFFFNKYLGIHIINFLCFIRKWRFSVQRVEMCNQAMSRIREGSRRRPHAGRPARRWQQTRTVGPPTGRHAKASRLRSAARARARQSTLPFACRRSVERAPPLLPILSGGHSVRGARAYIVVCLQLTDEDNVLFRTKRDFARCSGERRG